MAGVVPWSYSSLTAFETCPKRFYLTRISKQVKEPQTEATLWGNEVHKALELAVAGTKALAPNFVQYQPIVERLRASPGKKHTEQKFGLTNSFKPTSFFGGDVWFRGVLDLTIVTPKVGIVLDYKGLALDTPLPTPTGWTTMGDVKVGDVLFGSDGKPCRVTGKSTVQHKPCYRLVFDDTCEVVADEDHLWCVNDEVIDTKTLANTLVRNNQRYRKVKLTAPLATAEVKLPIDPYVLGCWLGDGKATSGEICKPDAEFWSNIEARGYEVGSDISGACDAARSSTVYGLRTQLREAGLLGNKHIPKVYLRASTEQRLALLQGLFDSDGSANSTRKQIVFSTTDESLADGVFELLVSLGQRPLKNSVVATGFGKTVKAYPVSFRPQGNMEFFKLTRKLRLTKDWGPGHSYRRLIVSVDPIESVPTQCIEVDSSDNTYLCTRHMLITHNTGKVKTDGDQLKLFAAATFAQHPYLDTVKTGYLWLANDKVTTQDFKKEDVPVIWQEFLPRIQRMEAAQEADKWLPNPSGLCKSWCPVGKKLCEFCGKD